MTDARQPGMSRMNEHSAWKISRRSSQLAALAAAAQLSAWGCASSETSATSSPSPTASAVAAPPLRTESTCGTCPSCSYCDSTSTCIACPVPYSCGASGGCDGFVGLRCNDGNGLHCSGGGTCVMAANGAGTCCTASSCGAYACAAGTGACNTTCSVDGDCAVGHHCDGGSCKPNGALGEACPGGKAAWCESGFCVDGVCCGTASCPQCGACNLGGGTCKPVTGAPTGGRTACASSTDVCASLGCDGVDMAGCHYPTSATKCSADGCSAGLEHHASSCNGAGGCSDTAKPCLPYACGATSCKSTCAGDADCASGFSCSLPAGKCVSGATCTADKSQSIAKDGTISTCAPYLCGPAGVCNTACATSADCSPGGSCQGAVCIPGNNRGGGGCALGVSRDAESSRACLAFGLVAIGMTARSRRRSIERAARTR